MAKYARRVAMALCKANPIAGIPYKGEHFDEETGKCLLTLTQRANNLLKEIGTYGAYVVEGDPHGWDGDSVCTISMEPKGGDDDVTMPLDYWEGGDEVSCDASGMLKGLFIEFANAGVACVYKI